MSYFMKSTQDYLKNITLSNIPEYFTKKEDEGDAKSGHFTFVTVNLDDVYGEIARFHVSWQKTNPLRYHLGKESYKLMNEYINIGVGFRKKEIYETSQGHKANMMIGARKEAKRGKIYVTNYVISNFCCDVTERAFTIRMNVFQENFKRMEEHVKAMFEGVICH